MANIRFFTTGDGSEIAFSVEGQSDKPVLLLSNSIGTTIQMWDELVPLLSTRFQLVRYDARGHGASAVPSGGYGIDRLGRDVLELMDHLQLHQVHFAGLSLGGFVGQWLGIHAPERFSSLTLANTSSYLGPAPQWDAAIREILAAPDMQDTASNFINNWFSEATQKAMPERVQRFYSDLLAMSAQGIAANLAAVRDTDMRRTISLIKLPTLIIAGQHDTVTLASHSELMASTIAHAQLVLFDAVHMSHVEHPAAFAQKLIGFVDSSGSAVD